LQIRSIASFLGGLMAQELTTKEYCEENIFPPGLSQSISQMPPGPFLMERTVRTFTFHPPTFPHTGLLKKDGESWGPAVHSDLPHQVQCKTQRDIQNRRVDDQRLGVIL
jgi:hypothetical protein